MRSASDQWKYVMPTKSTGKFVRAILLRLRNIRNFGFHSTQVVVSISPACWGLVCDIIVLLNGTFLTGHGYNVNELISWKAFEISLNTGPCYPKQKFQPRVRHNFFLERFAWGYPLCFLLIGDNLPGLSRGPRTPRENSPKYKENIRQVIDGLGAMTSAHRQIK